MSKRNLYKPAPSQTPPRLSRRSLTQGRLVSMDPCALLDNLSPSVQKVSSPNQPTTPRARRSLDYQAFSSTTTTSDQHPPPYRITPTIVKSPSHVKPSSSLSLSDTEGEGKSEPLNNQLRSNQTLLNQPTVLTVDASQRHSSFKDNEVPITTSYVKSPVKVVCHSPMRHDISRSISNNAEYGHAGKMRVPVDAVPQMNVLEESSASPPASEGSLSTVAGSPVDRRSKAIETMIVREKNNPKSFVSFLEEDDSERDTFDQSEIHVTQPRFDDTVISSIAGDSTINSFADDTMRKKKRKPRVVKSKYMAQSRMDQKSTTKRADPAPKVPNKPALESSKTRPALETSKIKKAKTKADSSRLNEKKTDQKARKPQFTSTPSEVIHHPAIIDRVPVITAVTVRPGTRDEEKSRRTPKKKVTVKDVSHKDEEKTEQSSTGRPTKQTSSDINQLELDLQYARLCQWRFLRSKFKHTFEMQEKEAQEQMYSMWSVNEKLRKNNCELKIEIENKTKEEEIDRQLELQLSWLQSVDRNLSRLIPDYNSLSEGIDTTRHHIMVKDVALPNNEADLLGALDGCENTLGEITSLLQNDETRVLSFSEEINVLAHTLLEETKEHERCIELLAAASTLSTHEKSLQADIIQRKEPQ